MAITGQGIIQEAMTEIRVLKFGEPIPADRVALALRKLNRLLENFSLNDLLIFALVTETFDLVAGTSTYTIGSGGNFDTDRPIKIKDSAFIRDGGEDFKVRLFTDPEYRLRRTKTVSARPRIMTYRPEFPLGKILLYPTPDSSNFDLHIQSQKILNSFATKTTSVTFAPGYERLVIYGLAIDLAPSFGKAVSTELAALFQDARQSIERVNSEPVEPVQLEIAAMDRSRRSLSHSGSIIEGPF